MCHCPDLFMVQYLLLSKVEYEILQFTHGPVLITFSEVDYETLPSEIRPSFLP